MPGHPEVTEIASSEYVESGPLHIGSLDIDVVVEPGCRSVRLTVERDARVVVLAPEGVRRTALESALRKRLPWIYPKMEDRRAEARARPVKEFVDGEGFHYLGRSHRLKLTEQRGKPVSLLQGQLMLRRDRLPSASQELITWYVERGRDWLPRRLPAWAERMAAPVEELDVRPLGYRWGSCSRNGRVNIHWATMQLPTALIDYVLVHELAHLHHPNHSDAFWRTVSRAMPDFAAKRDRLDAWGPQLWLPDGRP